MSLARIEFAEPNQLQVIGEINHQNVNQLLRDGKAIMRQHAHLQVDLSQVHHANSAGVALLTEWLRFAKANNKTLSFSKVPEQMLAIIELGGLAKLLPIQD